MVACRRCSDGEMTLVAAPHIPASPLALTTGKSQKQSPNSHELRKTVRRCLEYPPCLLLLLVVVQQPALLLHLVDTTSQIWPSHRSILGRSSMGGPSGVSEKSVTYMHNKAKFTLNLPTQQGPALSAMSDDVCDRMREHGA